MSMPFRNNLQIGWANTVLLSTRLWNVEMGIRWTFKEKKNISWRDTIQDKIVRRAEVTGSNIFEAEWIFFK